VIVNPTLAGRSIVLWPSQTKFDAPDNRTPDIQSTSSHHRPLFLNRPMISILEYLGVKNESFINLQEMAIRDIQSSRTSFLKASKLLAQHGLGASFRLPSLLTNLKTQFNLGPAGVSIFKDDCLDHHLINESIRCACAHALREIKHGAHIPVPDRLFPIAQPYSLSKHVDSHLSEEELVSGTIIAHWADHNRRSFL